MVAYEHNLPGMAQVVEQMLVKAFVPHLLIEAFDEPALDWRARGDVVPVDLVTLVPFQDGVANDTSDLRAAKPISQFAISGRLNLI